MKTKQNEKLDDFHDVFKANDTWVFMDTFKFCVKD